MEVKLRDLIVSQDALSDLCGQKVSAKMTYTLALVLNAVRPHISAYQQAAEVLREKYFIPDERNKDVLRVDPQKREAFNKESESLLEQKIVLSGIGKIPYSVITTENVTLNALNLSLLEWLIKQDDTTDTFFETT